MAKEMIILFQTDEWHSEDSKYLLGIFTSKHHAITVLKKYIEFSDLELLSENDLDNLEKINQTQGRDENYMLVSIIPNQIHE